MRFFSWFAILTLALGLDAVAATPKRPKHRDTRTDQPTATVRIHLVSNIGTVLEGDVKVGLFQDVNRSNPPNLASRFTGGVASGIPYGIYLLRVSTSGFRSAEREVHIFQPHALVVMGLELGGIDGGLLTGTSTIIGKLENVRSGDSSIHLRLSGAYSGTVMDADPKSDGNFEFSGVPNGVYIMLTTREGDLQAHRDAKILDCRQVSVPASEPVVIELSSR